MAFEYFTEAELRALPHMSDTTKFTTARCDAAAAYIVGIIERVGEFPIKVLGAAVTMRLKNDTHVLSRCVKSAQDRPDFGRVMRVIIEH